MITETSRLIATKIMGWKEIHVHFCDVAQTEFHGWEKPVDLNPGGDNHHISFDDFDPENDIEQAIEAAKKWLQDGHSTFDLEMARNGPYGKMWYVCILCRNDKAISGNSENSPSQAITAALISAVGEK
jgi:hypothetical protein